MAILKKYTPDIHDIHTYNPQASYTPSINGFQTGYNQNCHGSFIDWSGVSIRPRVFCKVISPEFRIDFTSPFEEWNINFWNTCNPCAVLISPKHALICQHYRGTFNRDEEYYTFLGKSGTRHTRKVVNVTLNIGPDHTLLEFDYPISEMDVKIYHKFADMKYVKPNVDFWIHDSNGKAYKMKYTNTILNTNGIVSHFNYSPSMDENNIGITSSGWPAIFVGDSGSPAFFVDQYGQTTFIGLMHGGMCINETELNAINYKINQHGYSVSYVKINALASDINQDGSVDAQDLSLLTNSWGTNDVFKDLNRDGRIDASDMSILLAEWGSYSMQNGIYINYISSSSSSSFNSKPRI